MAQVEAFSAVSECVRHLHALKGGNQRLLVLLSIKVFRCSFNIYIRRHLTDMMRHFTAVLQRAARGLHYRKRLNDLLPPFVIQWPSRTRSKDKLH